MLRGRTDNQTQPEIVGTIKTEKTIKSVLQHPSHGAKRHSPKEQRTNTLLGEKENVNVIHPNSSNLF